MIRRRLTIIACLLMVSLVACRSAGHHFDGRRAFKHVDALCKLGPRHVGSEGNERASVYIANVLERYGWEVEAQDFAYRGERLRNVIGKKGTGPIIILGTHYDTRPLADRDPVDRSQPVLGANDGGSGVGVLLELARVLDESATDQAEIWLVFFDGEDRGDIDGWSWCVGSWHLATSLSEHLENRPEYVLIIDMIGDKEQEIYYEWSSALWMEERIWRIADDLGYEEQFIPEYGYHIIDDHTPFLESGMTAALVIDFDYPYHHTRYDTLDKISADSLQRVGEVIQVLLEGEPFASPVERSGS